MARWLINVGFRPRVSTGNNYYYYYLGRHVIRYLPRAVGVWKRSGIDDSKSKRRTKNNRTSERKEVYLQSSPSLISPFFLTPFRPLGGRGRRVSGNITGLVARQPIRAAQVCDSPMNNASSGRLHLAAAVRPKLRSPFRGLYAFNRNRLAGMRAPSFLNHGTCACCLKTIHYY